MACGVPALAHPACGMAEIITPRQDGWLAEINTPEGLLKQLEALPSGPEVFAAMGRAGREKVVRQFSLPGMVENYRRLYREAAGAAWPGES
jgi:glycosyltransferase involved in cell wall biosynthesis